VADDPVVRATLLIGAVDISDDERKVVDGVIADFVGLSR
jgi:hypothetical protein